MAYKSSSDKQPMAENQSAAEKQNTCWMNDFTDAMLKNGYKLYTGKFIKSVKNVKDGFEVSFYGWDRSVVDLKKNIRNSYDYKCNCFDARYGGRKCNHMAAALFAVLGTGEDKIEPGKEIKPFSKADGDDYHYFSMDKMTENVIVCENLYQSAQKMTAEGRVTGSKFTLGQRMNGNDKIIKTIYGSVDITTDSGFKGKVSLDFETDKMCSAECSIPGCYYEFNGYLGHYDAKKPCRHVLAAMLVMENYIKTFNPGDATDDRAKSLLSRFRVRNSGNDVGFKKEIVKIEPELQNDDGELSVAFKIGTGSKLLKVKNLTDLVNIVNDGATLSLGKSLNINFALSKFDEKSQKFFDFIQAKVKDNLQRNQRMAVRARWGYYAAVLEKISGTIPLDGSAVDVMYGLFSLLPSVSYVEKKYGTIDSKGMITCSEAAPKIKMELKELKEGKNQTGVTLSGTIPTFCIGAGSAYYADREHLYRIPDDVYQQLQPVIELADDEGKIRLNFGRRNLGEFYYSVLPLLREVIDIDDHTQGRIDRILPPKLEIVYYLDCIDGMPVCQVKANYGETLKYATDAFNVAAFSESYRDYYKEMEAASLARKFFSEFDKENNELRCVNDDEAYSLYHDGVDELLKLGEIQCTDRFQGRSLHSVAVKVGVSLESDLLDLEISSTDVTRKELAEILASYRLRKKYHKLKNGDYIDLDDENLTMVMNLLDSCNASPKDIIGDKIKIPVYRSLYLDKMLENNEELYSHRDRNFRKIVKDFATIKDSEIEVPATLESTLRNYQVYGYKWIRTLSQNGFGGILADEMGLGKTLQVITAILSYKDENMGTSLIVCPASLVYNWKEEFLRFAPELKVETVAAGAKQRHTQIADYKDADVLVTSYDLLKRDIAEYEKVNFAYCVLDEAQYVKNSKTSAAKTVKVIKASRKLALTGTPIENRLSELWSIFDFLMPGFLFNYETFRKNFETPIAKDKDQTVSDRLKKLVGPFILRRLKSEVLKDLPDKIEEIHYAVMDEEQQKIYDAQVSRITKKLKSEDDDQFRKTKIEILSELTKARQICCDPHLLFENYEGESAKTEAAIELIQSAIEGEHRILLFSQFTSMLEVLEKKLSENEIPYLKLTGETPKDERICMMKEFNEGDIPVFLISLKAGGTGLNLTGADVVIHYDPWWNVAVQNQATDRAHRIGQTRNVTVYKLIIKDSIEEKIVKLQEAKKNLADEILNGENGNIGSLTREDLLNLLGV